MGCAMRRDAPEEAEPEKPEPDEIPAPPAGSPEPSGDEEEEEPPMTESSHTFIGLAMISGFILMYLIDKLPRIASSHLSGSDLPHHISLNNLGAGLQRSSSIGSLENGSLLDPVSAPKSRPPNRRSFTTTLGLVIHALADGIALGASSTSADVSLNLIVFVAIMVHKAPAAFGLTTTLLKQGVSRRRIRTHLLAFSVAAPIGALATWLFMSLISNYTLDPRGPEQPDSKWWTGHLLLFSAGTFMYVAMHGLQEEEDSSKAITSASMLDSDGSASHIRSSSSLETVAAVGGMLLPLLTQFGHHH